MEDRKLVKWLLLLLLLPLGLALCSGDRFRYPCQDPANWDKDFCKMPICDVTRTCPEHIFKGQRDPRLGPPKDDPTKPDIKPLPQVGAAPISQGANCGKS
jgi:hypothetical protein